MTTLITPPPAPSTRSSVWGTCHLLNPGDRDTHPEDSETAIESTAGTPKVSPEQWVSGMRCSTLGRKDHPVPALLSCDPGVQGQGLSPRAMLLAQPQQPNPGASSHRDQPSNTRRRTLCTLQMGKLRHGDQLTAERANRRAGNVPAGEERGCHASPRVSLRNHGQEGKHQTRCRTSSPGAHSWVPAPPRGPALVRAARLPPSASSRARPLSPLSTAPQAGALAVCRATARPPPFDSGQKSAGTQRLDEKRPGGDQTQPWVLPSLPRRMLRPRCSLIGDWGGRSSFRGSRCHPGCCGLRDAPGEQPGHRGAPAPGV